MCSLPVRLVGLCTYIKHYLLNFISLLSCDVQPMLDTEGDGGKRASRIVDPVCVFWDFSLSTEEYV